LQDYLAEFNRFSNEGLSNVTHMGRSLALEMGKTTSKNELATGKKFLVLHCLAVKDLD
jgi:phosphatidylinositol 4-kinase